MLPCLLSTKLAAWGPRIWKKLNQLKEGLYKVKKIKERRYINGEQLITDREYYAKGGFCLQEVEVSTGPLGNGRSQPAECLGKAN